MKMGHLSYVRKMPVPRITSKATFVCVCMCACIYLCERVHACVFVDVCEYVHVRAFLKSTHTLSQRTFSHHRLGLQEEGHLLARCGPGQVAGREASEHNTRQQPSFKSHHVLKSECYTSVCLFICFVVESKAVHTLKQNKQN